MSALLIFIALSVVVGFTYQVSRSVAQNTVDESLNASLTLQGKFRELDERELLAVLESISSDPNFVAYIETALNASFVESIDTPIDGNDGESQIDISSIIDLIDERRVLIDAEFMIITDVDGNIIAHTERPDWQGNNIA